MEAEKRKIAMLSVHSSPLGRLGTNDTGGMSICIRETARELGEIGHVVDIFTRQGDPGHKPILEFSKNVRLIHLRAGEADYIPKEAIYPLLTQLFGELERFRRAEGTHYDVIHSHYWLSGKVGDYAQKQWCVPHVVTFHTLGAVKNATDGVEREPELRVLTEKQLSKTCQRVIAATLREKEDLIRYYGASPDAVKVIPCGVNPDIFRPLSREQSRQRLGLDPNGFLLLHVGRFVPSKGTDRLLEAMSHLRNDRPYRLLIVGGDDLDTAEARSLRNLSRDHGVQDSVTFVGRVEHEALPAYYSAADLLVVPSRYESFGLVALESLACGTPVVATRVGAMEKVLREGETGHLVNNGSPRLLAEGIETFIPVSRSLSADAISASVIGFGWEKVASALVGEYETIIRECQVGS